MRHWSLLGIRNLRVRPGRSASAALAVALGVGIVVWITSAHASFMRGITDQVQGWIGRSHISIEPSFLGVVEESLVEKVRELENVRLVCPKAKFHCRWVQPGDLAGEMAPEDNLGSVDVVGIVPEVEYEFRIFRGPDHPLSERSHPTHGRLLGPGEHDKCMIEDALAVQHDLSIGDTIGLAAEPGGRISRFEIVGRYTQHRVVQFQRPTVVVLLDELQSIRRMQGNVSVIDVILQDDSLQALRSATTAIRDIIAAAGLNYPVSTAEARMRQLEDAREFTRFFLGLLSVISFLTAAFVVVTTLSMGMIERMSQLGMMRCIGVTRLQLALIVLCEIVPIGVVGALVGVPLGIGLTWISVSVVPEYIQEMVISRPGVWLGMVGGLLTSVISGLVPAIQASMVSPLVATRSQISRPSAKMIAFAASLGVLLIVLHEIGLALVPGYLWFNGLVNAVSALLLYVGYALLAPAAVFLSCRVFAVLATVFLRTRRELVQDQTSGTPWRSGTICTGFMVALSMVVCITVHIDSVTQGWDFPTRIPEGFVWMFRQVPRSKLASAGAVAGTKDITGLTNFFCKIDSADKKGVALFRFPSSMFVAVEVESFLELTELEYLEGEQAEAKAKMLRGGYILVPQDAAHVLNLHVGDRVTIRHVAKAHVFEVAGVVKSPSLDVAAVFFQMESQVMKAAGSSIIGSLADAQQYFGIDHLSLFLINMENPDEQYPAPDFFHAKIPPERISPRFMGELLLKWQDALPQYAQTIGRLRAESAGRRGLIDNSVAGDEIVDKSKTAVDLKPFTGALRLVAQNFWFDATAQERWQRFIEQVVLHRIKYSVDRPNAFTCSIRQLKEMADRELRRATRLLTTIPMIGLIVAALGAGNLMMANVAVRARQIAILRAVGASKWQVVRLVFAEAMILGILGTAFGCVVGLHAAHSINIATLSVWGYQPVWSVPWDWVGLGVFITMGTSLLAGVIPAIHAARSNIIAAMVAT